MKLSDLAIIAIIAFTVFSTGCVASQTGNIAQEVKAAVRAAVDDGKRTGIVIGQIHRGKTSIFGYGTTSAENGQIPNGDTLFALGSITKVFTAESLAALTQNHVVSLATTLGEVWPTVLDDNLITLGQLANHTAGLPRELPRDLLVSNDETHLLSLLDQTSSQKIGQASQVGPPAYSNLGMAVLARALVAASGYDQPELTSRYITSPLGMNRSSYTQIPDGNVASPHRNGLEISASRHATPSIAFGSGGLYSTAQDLLSFLEAHLNPTGSPIESIIEITEEGWGDYPLGWQVHGDGEAKIFYHSGDGDGYQSFIGYRRDRGIAVVLLANSSDDDDLQKIALHMLDASVPLPSFVDARSGTLSNQTLDRYLGTYRLEADGPEGNLIFIENLDGRLVYKETTSDGSLVRRSPMKIQEQHVFLVEGLPVFIVFSETPEGRVYLVFDDTEYSLVRVE